MPPALANAVWISLILGLFWLDRKETSSSAALWLPVLWFVLACSRSVAQWLEVGSPLVSPDQLMEGSLTDRLVYTCLLSIGIVVLLSRRDRVTRLLRANGPIILFFLYCAVSLCWSDYPAIAFKRWTKALGDLVAILIILTDREPGAAVERLLSRTSFLLVPLSILFIKYYPELGRSYGYWEGEVHYTGVTSNKNTLGVLCLFFGLGSIWRILADYHREKGKTLARRLIAQGTILVMVLWLFWKASSMTSLACFLLAGSLLLALSSRLGTRRPALIHLAVVAILCASAAVLFLGASPDLLEKMGRNSTLTDRTGVWAVTTSLNPNNLFGAGFESFWLGPRLEKIWKLYWWRPNEAHNGYVEIFLNLGWTGVILLTLVLASGYRAVFAAWRRRVFVGNLMLAFFVAGIVYNFTEAAFFKMMAPAWMFILLAMLGASTVHRKVQPAATNPLRHLKPPTQQAATTLGGEVA